MVLFEGLPFPISMVYIKTAGDKDVTSIPFSEALAILTNVEFDYRASQIKTKEMGVAHYVIKGDTAAEKNRVYIVSKTELIQRLQTDIYDDVEEETKKITDIAVQPEDERLIADVITLIGT